MSNMTSKSSYKNLSARIAEQQQDPQAEWNHISLALPVSFPTPPITARSPPPLHFQEETYTRRRLHFTPLTDSTDGSRIYWIQPPQQQPFPISPSTVLSRFGAPFCSPRTLPAVRASVAVRRGRNL